MKTVEVLQEMRAKSFAQTKIWAEERELNLSKLTEDEIMELVAEGVRKIRELESATRFTISKGGK